MTDIDYDHAMELTDKLPKVHGQAIRQVLQSLRHQVATLQADNDVLRQMTNNSDVTDLDSRFIMGSENLGSKWFRLKDDYFQFALPGPLFQRFIGGPMRPCYAGLSSQIVGAMRLSFDDSVVVHQPAGNCVDIFPARLLPSK